MAKSVRIFQGTSEEIVASLTELEGVDKTSERTWKYGCLLGLVGTLFPFIAGIALQPAPSWTLAVGLAIACAGVIVYLKGSHGDVDDSRYKALGRLHRFLSGDADKDTQYHYVLDLRAYTDKAFYVRTEKFGGMFSLPRGKVEFYECPVLYGQVGLRDGTMLSVSVNRSVKKLTRTKRGYSGKTKTKTKYKYSSVYSLKAKLPEGLPVKLGNASSPASAHALPAILKKKKSLGNKISASAKTRTRGQDLDVDGLLGLLAQTFHQVHLQRHRPA
jgi:hypothetical protein